MWKTILLCITVGLGALAARAFVFVVEPTTTPGESLDIQAAIDAALAA